MGHIGAKELLFRTFRENIEFFTFSLLGNFQPYFHFLSQPDAASISTSNPYSSQNHLLTDTLIHMIFIFHSHILSSYFFIFDFHFSSLSHLWAYFDYSITITIILFDLIISATSFWLAHQVQLCFDCAIVSDH